MNSFGKLVVKMGLVSLLSVMPLAAQIDNGLDFTTSFPFYAGNAKMPAGSYKISQTDIDSSVLQIQSSDGLHSALVEFIPTQFRHTAFYSRVQQECVRVGGQIPLMRDHISIPRVHDCRKTRIHGG